MEVTGAFLRIGHKFRPGSAIVPTSITVHNTGNPRSTAANERAWLDNPRNLSSGNFASWHYVLDETSIIQAIPDFELAYHAEAGNTTSIGIEVCESGNQHVVWRRAVLFVVSLLRRHGFDAERVRTHRDWTGKDCPRLILPEWTRFMRDLRLELGEHPAFTNVRIEMSGETREFQGIMAAGRSFVPTRPLLEQLGYTVNWDENTASVKIARDAVRTSLMPELWARGN
ncbi:MAG: N-acetylmuramoyl-L-alanine amidase CwlA [Firmicutes bacterium]|nr:N-acetylmuramoyl-L-alanine amidase CwlA [candidate division NPL-UPA2 bacterium]